MATTTGKRALVEILRSEGVEYVFGIPGATEIQFMDALEEASDIRYILGLQEVVCAGMAEGYARASGKVGFLNLHTAPGLGAATPMLYNAQLGKVPLVVTVGQNDTRLLQYDPHLSGDIVGIGKPHVKWSTEVVHAEDIPTVMQRAFKMATQAPTGPVLVSIPQNVLEQELDFHEGPSTAVYSRLRPDPAVMERAVALLADAARPVILVESGVTRSDALAEVVRLAELTGSRVFQHWMADVNFPVTHPQYLGDLDPTGPEAFEILQDADVLVGVGCSLFTHGFVHPKGPVLLNTRLIHIDDDPWELGKNLPTDCAIQGDVKAVLLELNETLAASQSPGNKRQVADRASQVGRQKAAADAALESRWIAEKDQVPISISRLMAEVRELMGPDVVIVDECWSSSPTLRGMLPLNEPNSFYRSRKGGSIGWGLPGAMGVKLGRPDKEVVALLGDGSAAWSIQGLWTAARYQIPVTFVITNNGVYRQVKLVRKAVLGDYPLDEKHEGMELDSPVIDFHLLAEAMGVESRRVARPEDLGEALGDAVGSGSPHLVEVMVENKA